MESGAAVGRRFLVAFALFSQMFNISALLGGGSSSSFASYGGRVLYDGRELTPYGWWSALIEALNVGWRGGLIGLAIWRVAYRRTRK